MRNGFLTLSLVFVAVAATTAQDRPDFSGRWILARPNPAPSSVAQMLIVRQSFKRESIRGTPIDPPLITLAVERRGSVLRSAVYTIGSGGGATSGGVPGSRLRTETRNSTKWGPSLPVHRLEDRKSARRRARGAASLVCWESAL